MDSNPACPCGSAKSFSACCEPFLNGPALAETAEQLMRSRFSAFCLQNVSYLINTLQPSKRQPDDAASLQQSMQQTCWIKLKVLKTGHGKKGDSQGIVEFAATFEEQGEFYQLHETSHFVFEQRWYYSEGEHQVSAIKLKIGRNDPCWCGLAKKYKNCHGH